MESCSTTSTTFEYTTGRALMSIFSRLNLRILSSFTMATCLTLAWPTSNVHADVPSGAGKGIVGGGLLGAELGFLTLAASGARSWWFYATIPPATCAGGIIGGYFIERNATSEIPIAMLAGGIALIIPTVVATLSAVAYRPGPEETVPVDAVPSPTPTKVEVKTGQKSTHLHVASSTKVRPTRVWPPALLNYNEGQKEIQLSMPMLQLKPSYSTRELAQFGVPQRLEVHAPVVAVAF